MLLGQDVCPTCRAAVSPALRDVLDERLASAHADYREATRVVRFTSVGLLVLGALHVTWGLFVVWVATPATAEEGHLALAYPACNLVIGVALLGCARAAKRAPTAAMAAALAVWTVLAPAELLLSLVSSAGISSVMATIAIFAGLIRGLLAARRLARIRADIAREARANETSGEQAVYRTSSGR